MFILTILEKNLKNQIKIFSRKCNSIIKNGKISRRVKLTNTQLSKLKSTAQKKTETILRLNEKKIENKKLQHELFLTTR